MSGRAFIVRGTVQGVGFRPFVHRLAVEEGLTGEVRNTPEGVTIVAFGPEYALGRFRERLVNEPPALARIERIEERAAMEPAPREFRIAASAGLSTEMAGPAAITADAAICADCLAELSDPDDRRYRYPFINCTNCGPRFSIVEAVPYDRAATTMRAFEMCEACAREYADPADRRFHAEPIACPACGPSLRLVTGDGACDGDAISRAADMLRAGRIIGVMGLGGFHLAVRAEDAEAVAQLRARKQRPSKPLALMVRDLPVAQRYAALSKVARDHLTRAAVPIVLAPARHMPEHVAPGLAEIGVMLPATPLHVLLLAPFDEALVMTSANRSGEPPVTTYADALRQLGDVADAWLIHDRAIANRVDDSVVAIRGGHARMIRRARGFAPTPIALPEGFGNHPPILAMGGDLKNAFAMAEDGRVVLSQHIGDLASRKVETELKRTLKLLAAMTGFRAAHVAVDAHPAYRSRRIGERLAADEGVALHAIGHHHAHVAACLAENDVPCDAPPVLALTLDGIGADEDGRLLGCELWRADYARAVHLGGLAPTVLLGGDRAAKEPWRNLLARLDDAFGPDPADWPAALAARLKDRPVAALLAARRAEINTPAVSSAGRLFDAVAAALGLCEAGQDYEAEAPMRLEALADGEAEAAEDAYPFAVERRDGRLVLDPRPLWQTIGDDLSAGAAPGAISARFHRGLAEGLCAMVRVLSPEPGTAIALSGGGFHNARLAATVRRGCEAMGLRVLEHEAVPAGDGGLALGQTAVLIARLRA